MTKNPICRNGKKSVCICVSSVAKNTLIRSRDRISPRHCVSRESRCTSGRTAVRPKINLLLAANNPYLRRILCLNSFRAHFLSCFMPLSRLALIQRTCGYHNSFSILDIQSILGLLGFYFMMSQSPGNCHG